MAVNLLKNIYQDDFMAVAQIITAEADENKEILIEYLECVEDFVKKLKVIEICLTKYPHGVYNLIKKRSPYK